MVDRIPVEDLEPWVRDLLTDVSLASNLNLPLSDVSRLNRKSRQALIVYLKAQEEVRKEKKRLAREGASVSRGRF